MSPIYFWRSVIPVPIAISEGLFVEGNSPCLIGWRNKISGKVVFPCPLDPEMFEPVDLPRTGRLWSWTVQRFRPKSPPYTGPKEFKPYAVGYIELEGVVIVESRLANVAFEDLKIGMEMEFALERFIDDKDGRQVMTYAFMPFRRGAAQ